MKKTQQLCYRENDIVNDLTYTRGQIGPDLVIFISVNL